MRGPKFEMAEHVNEWRKRAQRLRALARITHRRQAQAELMDLAKQWEGMAAKAESALRRKLVPAGSLAGTFARPHT
jgi:hypothetical protein